MRFAGVLIILALLLSPCLAEAPLPVPTFDAARHMRVAEVKPGMKGYGLSVFSGTQIERFEVEVVSVLRNFNPKQHVILIRATGANLELTGAIAGMSGSPIYLDDGAGGHRLVGAFAYGWPLMKDSLAGVQPIEYMLAMPLTPRGDEAAAGQVQVARGQWSVLSALEDGRRRLLASHEAPARAQGPQLTRLSLPLAVSGMNESTLQALGQVFAARGLVPLQAGGGGGEDDAEALPLAPGSVMAVPLIVGDIEATALGTCTDVIDGVVYGFGHPFTGAGPVALPMCGGTVAGVIPNLMTSFKIGSASRPVGTVVADHVSGVAGRLGAAPATAPMRWRVRYADGSLDQEYRFNAIVHPEFTPLLVGAAALGSMSGSRELPHFNTVEFELLVRFSNGQEVRLADRMANVNAMMLFSSISAALGVAAQNPFEQALVAGVKGTMVIRDGAEMAELRHIGSARQAYRPGETVRFSATLRPFRGTEITRELAMDLPDDLPEGSYSLIVSDAARFLTDEQSGRPHRFSAGNIDEVFAAINELSSLRSDAMYLRLNLTKPGVAVGRTALPQLPSTHRQMLLATGRSDVTAYTPSITRHVESDYVITGTAEMMIEVTRNPQGLRAPAAAPAPLLLPGQ